MDKIPVVKVFKTTDQKHYTFWCSFCNKFHYHGIAELGHRKAHCINLNSPYRKSGYILKEYTNKELKEFNLHKK